MENNDRTYFLRSNEELFNATLDMFSSMSYDIASLNDIIKNSHSNKGSFYYRFKDKYDLYLALIDALFIEQVSYLNMKAGQYETTTVEGLVRLLFDALINLINEDSRYLSLSSRFYAEKDSFINQVLNDTLKSPLERTISNIHNLKHKMNPFYVLTLTQFYGGFESYYQLPQFNFERFIQTLVHAIEEESNQEMMATDKLQSNSLFERGKYKSAIKKRSLVLLSDHLTHRDIADKLVQYDSFDEKSILFVSKKQSPYFKEKQCIVKTIHSKRTVKSYLSYYSKKNKVEFSNKEISLLDFLNTKIVDLDALHLLELYMVLYLADSYHRIIFKDVLEPLHRNEKAKLFEFLLKYQQKGSKIILLESRFSDSYLDVDEVVYITEDDFPMIASGEELRKKYNQDDVIVSLDRKMMLLSIQDFINHYSTVKDQVEFFTSLSSAYNMIYEFELGGNKE